MKKFSSRLPVLFLAGILFGQVLFAASGVSEDGRTITADASEMRVGLGSRNVFGGSNPSSADYTKLEQIGMSCFRAEIQYQDLFPSGTTLEKYRADRAAGDIGVADPSNWNWTGGVYGKNFVEKAYNIGADVVLLIWNPYWNSEEYRSGSVTNKRDACRSAPVDYDVWADVLKKVILHFNGGGIRKVDYIEIYNEPEHESVGPFSVYFESFRRAKEAMLEVAPDVEVGGPAWANWNEGKADWILGDEYSRMNLDFTSGHYGGTPIWPDADLDPSAWNFYLKQIEAGRPQHDMKFLRTEAYWDENSASTVSRIIESASEGVEFVGWWEIQPRGGSTDRNWWFGSGGPDGMCLMAQFYGVLAAGLQLGKGDFHPIDLHIGYQRSFAGVNSIGNPVVARLGSNSWSFNFINTGLPDGAVDVEIYRGNASTRGWQLAETLSATVSDGTISLNSIAGTYEGLTGARVLATVPIPGRGEPPVIEQGPSVSPNPITGTTAVCTVSASDPDGDDLSYEWSGTGPADVQFDGTGEQVTATFKQAGDYVISVSIFDGINWTRRSTGTVTVEAVATRIDLKTAP